MVESGVAEAATLRNGRAVFRSEEGGTVKGDIAAEPGFHLGATQFDIKLYEEGPEPSEFAFNCMLMSCGFRAAELKLFVENDPLPTSYFSEDFLLPPPYVRAFTGPIRLARDDGEALSCYPEIVLYRSGVLLVNFRILSPEHSIGVDGFTDQYLNLSLHHYHHVEVPPGISSLAPTAFHLYTIDPGSIRERYSLHKAQKEHGQEVESQTKKEEVGDFSFSFAPLSRSEFGPGESLKSVASTIFSIVGYLGSNPREGWDFIIRGHSRLPRMGNYWSGRPNAHLIRFEEQASTASENERVHGDHLGKVMSRTTEAVESGKEFLPENVRSFEDFGVYLNEAATLHIWSEKALEKVGYDNPISSDIIYEHQAQIELLEYGEMLHRSLSERATELSKYKEVLRARRDLANLEARMARVSRFGEVTDMFKEGWTRRGIEAIRSQLEANLVTLEKETEIEESRQFERLGISLTVLFGFLAVPTVANSIIAPLWSILEFWSPEGKELTQLFNLSVSFVLVALLVMGVLYWYLRK